MLVLLLGEIWGPDANIAHPVDAHAKTNAKFEQALQSPEVAIGPQTAIPSSYGTAGFEVN